MGWQYIVGGGWIGVAHLMPWKCLGVGEEFAMLLLANLTVDVENGIPAKFALLGRNANKLKREEDLKVSGIPILA